MRQVHRGLLLILAAAVLLMVPVFADMGPKDQLIVRVENGPDELYYLDLVQEGNYALPEEIRDSLAWNYTKEEFAALDQDILAAMTAAVPEGWSACIAQRATGVPMWGKLTGEDGVHEFGYVGVPVTCRILIATKSGEVFLSEPFTRKVLQSSVTVDWAARTVKAPPVSLDTRRSSWRPSCRPWPWRGRCFWRSVCGPSGTAWFFCWRTWRPRAD